MSGFLRRLFARRAPAAPTAPQPLKSITEVIPTEPFMHLQPGRVYRVVKAFTDYDHAAHPVGETWTFVTQNFVPYEDGLSLYVSVDGQERQIRLQWRGDQQGPVIDALAEHVVAV